MPSVLSVPTINGQGRAYVNGKKLDKVLIEHIKFFIEGHPEMTDYEISHHLPFSVNTIKKYRTNDVDTTQQGRNTFSGEKTSKLVCAFIKQSFDQIPTLFLWEVQYLLQHLCNVSISISQISKIKTEHLGYSWKRVETLCKYRQQPRVIEHRKDYKKLIRQFSIYDLFFIDESHFCFDMVVRRNGHSQVGSPCINSAHTVSRQRFSLLACINYAIGVVHFELVDTTTQAITAERFNDFMIRLVNKIPLNSFLVMDNATVHDEKAITSKLPSSIRLIFQSPYSPDFNPIELCFGWIKQRIKNFQYSSSSLEKIVKTAIAELPLSVIQSHIQHCQGVWYKDD